MKLNIPQYSLDEGIYPIRKKTSEKLKDVFLQQGAILIPWCAKLVFPTSVSETELKFTILPEFEVATTYNRDNEITGHTIQLQDGTQMTFTRQDEQSARYTMAGDGVGDIVKRGRVKSLEALTENHPASLRAIAFLRSKTVKAEAAA